MNRCIVYYTDSRLDEKIDVAVRNQILKACGDIPIISISQKPIDFGLNICVGFKPRCYVSLYEQLLFGLESCDADIVYLCEHDVLYHPSHFEFIPPKEDRIYFNLNRHYFSLYANYYLKTIGKRALSQCVSYKDVITDHVVEQYEQRKNNMSSPCVGPFENFESKYANIDIRHGGNFSDSKSFVDENHRSEQSFSLGYWGTPEQLMERVGFEKQENNTAKILHEMFSGPYEFYRSGLCTLFNQLGLKKGAEIGVKLGKFSKQLCEKIDGIELKCVDPWNPTADLCWDKAEEFCKIARETLRPYNAQIIRKTGNHAAAEDVAKWSLDFVYIDGDHSFIKVMQDIILWSARVRPGGIVSGHDYDNEDVKTAVDAYVDRNGYELFVTTKGESYPDSSPSWFFAK